MITNVELKKLQDLSKLSFSSDEEKNFTNKLKCVLDMIDRLRSVECDEVEPLRSVYEMHQRMRLDEVKVSDLSEDLFKNVPETGADLAKEIKCFVVPKVVE